MVTESHACSEIGPQGVCLSRPVLGNKRSIIEADDSLKALPPHQATP